MAKLTDEEHAARIRTTANQLAAEVEEAWTDGLHVECVLKSYYGWQDGKGNSGKGHWRAEVSAQRITIV